MKIVSGRIRFKGLLTKVQAIKYNAKHVSRGAFATAEELALQTNVNESMKRIDELQRKLLNWSEAQNYMQMGKHYARGGHAWCFLRLGRNVCWTNTRNIQWVKIMLVSRCDC